MLWSSGGAGLWHVDVVDNCQADGGSLGWESRDGSRSLGAVGNLRASHISSY